MQKKICAVYREDAVTGWFAKFRAGDFSLDYAPRSGRPIEVDQIETFIEKNQCYTTWEIANIFQLSKSIKLLVKMKNVPFILWKNYTDFLANPIFTFRSIKQRYWFCS